jgi:hypothetical protein
MRELAGRDAAAASLRPKEIPMSVPTPSLPAAALPAAALSAATTAAVPLTFLPDALQGCIEASTCWQQEIARFVDRRLAENLRSWQAVAAARDVAGLLKVPLEWSLNAATDYAEEARRIQQLATTLSLTGTTPAVQESAQLLG